MVFQCACDLLVDAASLITNAERAVTSQRFRSRRLNTFGRAYRFTSKKDIDLVFKHAKRYNTKSFRLFKSSNENSLNSKFAVIISKRTGSAVIRNACKRKVREWLRINKMNLDTSFHYIVYIKQDVSNTAFNKMNQEMTQLMVQSNHQRNLSS